MILFELSRQLDIRLYRTMNALDKSYGAIGKYILMDDMFILLGYDHSVRLNMMTRELSADAPMRSFEIESEPIMWFSEGSAESHVISMISNAMRQWLNVDSLRQAEFYEALESVNRVLSRYNLKILFDMDSMCIFYDGESMTFEQALFHIMEMDAEKETEAFLPEWFNEAEYLRTANRLEEAAERYEKVLKFTNRSQPIYTTSAFHLAECYYFLGNYERSVKLYYRCNLEFITNADDFYIHLGHALLDEKMKKYERQIKIFYHCRIDPEYALNHQQAMEAAGHEVADVFDEYENTCLSMGMKKYAEHRNHMPKDADDIDEILALDLIDTAEKSGPPRRYENIKLIEQPVQDDIGTRTWNELLADALDDYISGEYQKAFEIYLRMKEEVGEDSDYSTWIHFMLAKLYIVSEEYEKAQEALDHCDPNRFGLVYRLDDYLVLYAHTRIINDDFESNPNYRRLVRGRIDFYFAKYDQAYLQMTRELLLMNSYNKYEQECMESAKAALAEKMPKETEETVNRTKVESSLAKGLLKFFREKK
ncbi:MAG: tetratricopeptide repeat protein [Lachnospiraceae bacterium]|nr:tetratricopeptide repeat protein [Lachnospiraceae bacterium]